MRNATIASVTNVAARAISIATSFATIPLVLHHLGTERFGLWMTIASFTTLLAFTDFGIGNGLLNAVSDADGRNDRAQMRKLVSNAVAMLGGVALLLLLVALPLCLTSEFDWAGLFGLRDAVAIDEAPRAMAVFVVGLALTMVSAVIQKTQLALQTGMLNAVSNGAGALLGLAGVLLGIHAGAGLPVLLAALLGGPIVATCLTGLWFFGRAQPDLRPRAADVDLGTTQRLLSLGALFFVLQVTSAMSFMSDNLIGARFVGAEEVADFSIVAKLCGGISLIVGIALTSLWPAYAEAIARGDIAWVANTLRRSIVGIAALTSLLSLLLYLGFGPITAVWLQREVMPSAWLLVGMLVWTVIGSVGNAIAFFLNGAHIVKVQLVIAGVSTAVCLFLKIVCVQRWGLTALPWVTVTSYAVTTLVPYALLLPRIFASLQVRAPSPMALAV